jgi:hypothetical protein
LHFRDLRVGRAGHPRGRGDSGWACRRRRVSKRSQPGPSMRTVTEKKAPAVRVTQAAWGAVERRVHPHHQCAGAPGRAGRAHRLVDHRGGTAGGGGAAAAQPRGGDHRGGQHVRPAHQQALSLDLRIAERRSLLGMPVDPFLRRVDTDASAITGTNPARDTRWGSSNEACIFANPLPIAPARGGGSRLSRSLLRAVPTGYRLVSTAEVWTAEKVQAQVRARVVICRIRRRRKPCAASVV